MPRGQAIEIRNALLEQIFWRSNSPVRTVADIFRITRQAVQLHVQRLVRQKLVLAEGTGRWRRYRLAVLHQATQSFALGAGITEDRVWESFVRDQLRDDTPDAQEICHYGLTEMVNNVIDHSAGSELRVDVRRTAASLLLRVADNGIGIFQKIAASLALPDPRQALLELSKGKFTTDPARHTGEGLFFTSRAFDRFSIRSADLLFLHRSDSDDWLLETEDKDFKGTRIAMNLLLPPRRTLLDVFSRFSSGPEEHRFAKTHVPLKLATFGDESLVSRSSAKRVLARIERFDEALLDFSHVKSIGQAFADEIFRVFASQHPTVNLIPINANQQVTQMIRRAQAARAEGAP